MAPRFAFQAFFAANFRFIPWRDLFWHSSVGRALLRRRYGVEAKALKQAVRRTASRVPDDFVFVLGREEFARYRPMAVTTSGGRTSS